MTDHLQREHLGALMRLLLAHEPQVHYPTGDVRGPADLATFALDEHQMIRQLAAGGGLTMDCSAACTLLCKWAGLADPNGLDYRRCGYTGTMLDHLPHYSDPRGAGVGALCVFGPATGEHVCMVLEPGDDPLLFSHGFEGGPITVRLSAERTFHRPPVTFLSIAKL